MSSERREATSRPAQRTGRWQPITGPEPGRSASGPAPFSFVFSAAVLVATGWLLSGAFAARAVAQELTAFQAAQVLEQTLVDAIARTENSVVAIARVRTELVDLAEQRGAGGEFVPGLWNALEAPPTAPAFVPNEFASGVVIDARGLILTNYHVLGNPDENDYFVWIKQRPYKVTRIKAADPWLDLAVLQIDASDLQPITFGDASELKKGQIVLALGNPYAIARDGEVSASWGILSNFARQAPRGTPAANVADGRETLHHYGTLLQTDARLELGTSGGALVNLKGEMVGLVTSLAALEGTDQPGGFAIPVDEAFRRAVERLKAGQEVEYGFLGISTEPLAAEQRRQGRFGVHVVNVVTGTPADQAGLRPGDIITQVNGQPIRDDLGLIRDISRMPAGSEAKLTIERAATGRVEVLERTALLSKKYMGTRRPPIAEQPDPLWRGLHVEYATAIPQFLDRYLDPQGCVGVLEVHPDSLAWKAGLRAGDLISHVNDTRVSSPEQFHQVVSRQAGPVALRLVGRPEQEAVRTIPAP